MATKKKIDVALIYDFDGTLSPGNMQEFGFVQAIGKNPDAFWQKTVEMATTNDASGILCYMYLMLQEAKACGISLKRESFRKFGSMVELFKGVEEWFALINQYGKARGINIKHYINSSGLKEMIEGTPIAKRFENIYACSFLYNVDGVAYWPAVAVDYTTKTQFLFKINKGIREISDNKRINEFVAKEDRPIPFERMSLHERRQGAGRPLHRRLWQPQEEGGSRAPDTGEPRELRVQGRLHGGLGDTHHREAHPRQDTCRLRLRVASVVTTAFGEALIFVPRNNNVEIPLKTINYKTSVL